MGVTFKSVEVELDLVAGVMAVTVSGKLEKEDYETFNTEFDSMLSVHDRVRVLVELKDFHGWTAGAAWEDTKMGVRHYSDIERLAIVGENKWQKGMAMFVKPFTRAEVRYFDASDAEAAHAWVIAKA